MSILKKLKLYRVKTVVSYVVSCWRNSAFVLKQAPHRKRLTVYADLLKSFLRYGADFNDYCTFSFWNKKDEVKDTFITYRRNNLLRFAMSTPRVYGLFLDKAAFNERFSKWVKRDWISSTQSSFDEIKAFIERHPAVIAKPLSDYGGHGVIKIVGVGTGGGISDELNILKERVKAGEDFIIEEVIENCEKFKRLAPASLNTVRLVTVIDKAGEMHVIASLLRMGNGKAVTDNYHDGGMACEIDLKAMTLKGVAKGMSCVSYEKHPYSWIKFDGYAVPEVKKCLDILREVVFTEPEARYVGWDFALIADGSVELLEGNIPPGEDITQLNCERGLWYELQRWK